MRLNRLVLLSFFVLFVGQVSSYAGRRTLQGSAGWVAQHSRRLKQANCQRYPYIASLRDGEGNTACGGVLVHQRFVLTAAQCVDRLPGSDTQVVVGACNINSGRQAEVLKVQQAFVHDKWNGERQDGFDIALVLLTTPASQIQSQLPEAASELLGMTNLTTLGFLEDANLAAPLLGVEARHSIIPNDQCEDAWEGIVVDSMMCTSPPRGSEVCGGVTGGPLLGVSVQASGSLPGSSSRDVAVGITSIANYSLFCHPGSKLFTIYTRVSSFLDWIDSTIKSQDFTFSEPTPLSEECHCSLDGFSNGVDTKTRACHTWLPSGVEMCYLPGLGCSKATESVLFPGALWISCKNAVGRLASTTIVRQTKLEDEEKQEEANQDLLTVSRSPKDSSSATRFRKLLKKGADPNACCFSSYVPLQLVAMSDNDVGAIALVEAGADVTEQHSVDQRTALHTAVIRASVNVATFLISVMDDVDIRDDGGATPLHHAAVFNAKELTLQLIEHDADPNARDQAGDQPLHWAASGNATEATTVLIASEANVNGADTAGETPLHFAAKRGFVDIVEILIQNGADIRAEDKSGNKPGDEICKVSQDCTEDVLRALDRLLVE